MIPTAEEFLKSNSYITQDGAEDVHTSLYDVSEVMIEFAKLHVKAALENAAKYADLHSKYKPKIGEKPDINCNKYIYQASILNAYDLNQIK